MHFKFKKEIEVRLRNGLRFFVRGDKGGESKAFFEVFTNKIYNSGDFRIKEGDVVIDIGAQIGLFSLFAAKSADKVKVFSFEPDNNNFAILKKNVTHNKLKNIEIYRLAVSDKKGTAKLYQDARSYTTHSLVMESNPSGIYDTTTLIKCTTLASVFKENKIDFCDFLKMDCEGAEYAILFKAPPLVLQKIGKIAMECHDLDKKRNKKTMLTFLRSKGFKIMPPSHPNMILAQKE